MSVSLARAPKPGDPFWDLLVADARAWGMNPRDLALVMMAESTVNPSALNDNGGAAGLNQLSNPKNYAPLTRDAYLALDASAQWNLAVQKFFDAVITSHPSVKEGGARDLYWLNWAPATYKPNTPDDAVIVRPGVNYGTTQDPMMGEWMKMTNFERNFASKIPLFYPWVRYSMRLAAKSLPTHHPLTYGFAGQLATLSREHLRELLGTDTPTGKAPIGRAQPNLEPAERKWLWAGAPQADPLLNVITELLSAKPARMIGALPPYVAAPIEWMVNRGSFTDKPLKVSTPYVRGQQKEEERPPLGGTLAAKLLEATAPGRAAQDITAKGRPQAANSIFGSAPMHYSPRTEQAIEEEAEEKGKRSQYEKVGKYVFPLLPHREPGLLTAKLKEQKKQEEKAALSSGGW